MAYSLLFIDAIDHTTRWSDDNVGRNASIQARQAVVSAMRTLNRQRDWPFYHRAHRIHMPAPFETGTITYTHTGGSSERLLEFTETLSATVLAWIPNATLRVSDVNHYLEKMVVGSSTDAILDEFMNPAANIAALTAFNLFQSRFTLPEDFKSLDGLYHEGSYYEIAFVKASEWLQWERFTHGAGYPEVYTIMNDRTKRYRKAIAFHPYSDAARTLDTMMTFRPRELKTTGYGENDSKGTVTTDGTTTIEGTGTNFTAGMVGAYIRGSGSSTTPSDILGDNPYEFETKIVSVTDADTIIVADSIAALANVAYVISDPVDISEGMTEAFLRCCEWQMARLKNKKPAIQGESRQAYREALIDAAEEDAGPTTPRRFGENTVRRRLADYPIGPDD